MNYIKTKIIAGTLLLGIMLFAAYTVVFNNKHDRFVLFFKNSITKQIETEIRFVPKQTIKPKEVAFIEELLLGPVNHNQYAFLNPNEKPNSCFVKNGVLYIDFSENFLESIQNDFDNEDISELLKKNIFTNCLNINSVFISVNGAKIYEFFKKIA